METAPRTVTSYSKFLAGNLGCRVDGGSVFAHHEYLKLTVVPLASDEGFGFTTGGTIADGDGFDGVLLHQFGELAGGDAMFALWGMRVDGLVVQQIALCIQANDLTARAIAGVDAHHAFLSQRGSKQ